MVIRNLINRTFKSKTNYADAYKPISEAAYLESKIKKPKYRLFTKFAVYTLLYTYILSVSFNILLIRKSKFLESKLFELKTTIESINRSNAGLHGGDTKIEIEIEKSKEGIKDVKVRTSKKEPK